MVYVEYFLKQIKDNNMTVILKLLLFFSILISSLACCKSVPETQCPPDCPPEDTVRYPLDKVWESYHFDDTIPVLSRGEVKSYDNLILFNGYTLDDIQHIFVFDKNTGKRIKVFDLGYNTVRQMGIVDKYLIVPSLDDLKIFDLDALTLVKTFDGKYLEDLTIFGSSIYVPIYYGDIPYSDSSSIIKIYIPSFKTEKVLSVTAKEYGTFGALNSVSLDINNRGDTMMYGGLEGDPKLLYSYNISADSFAWKIPERGGDFFYYQPLFDDKYIYITNKRGAEAHDKFTGELIWRTDLPGDCGLRSSDPIFVDGKLYIKECGYHLFCLDAKDVSLIWHNKKDGGAPSNYMTYYNGMIYYGSQGNKLKIIDMKTGKLLLSTPSPYDNGEYVWNKKLWERFESVSPLIDGEAGVFYMPDRFRMFCFKIWEK